MDADDRAGLKDDNAMRAPCVLVAEDDDDIRGLIAASLRSDGFDVIEARDGAELIGCMGLPGEQNEAQSRPDVIVSDVRMPSVTGLQALALLRRVRLATPFVLITAFGAEETCAEANQLGAAAMIHKPFDIDDLRAVVQNAVPGDAWERCARWASYAERQFGLGDDLLPG
jgi:DNA-binding NtrC family response regulator